MGLALPSLRYLALEHKRRPFEEPVLTLGRQYVYATFDEVINLLKSEGIKPAKLENGISLTTNIPKWKNHPQRKRYTSDVIFFKLLGLEQFALDVTNYEDCDYVHDLNFPVPPVLKNKFGLILDGGTIEHVFNIKQAFENICLMLKSGGRIIHQSPGSNYCGHGFFQFSPELFFDFYGVNGFTDFQCYYVVTPLNKLLSKIYGNPSMHSWDIYKIDSPRFEGLLISNKPTGVYFSAQKTEMSTINKIPRQGDYFSLNIGLTNGDLKKVERNAYIKKLIPRALKPVIKLALQPLNKYLGNKKVRLSYKRPWGLKYKGKL